MAYDDVSLIRVGYSTNLVTNPGFEDTRLWSEVCNADYPGQRG